MDGMEEVEVWIVGWVGVEGWTSRREGGMCVDWWKCMDGWMGRWLKGEGRRDRRLEVQV